MLSSEKITLMLNSVIEAIRQVVPKDVELGRPSLTTAPVLQTDLCILVGITGDLKGRMVIEGQSNVFGKLGELMYGVLLEGDMMISFAGEFTNMVAGNSSRVIYEKGVTIDITPPTVMEGNTKLYGFTKALCVPAIIEGIGQLQVVLIIEE